MKKAHDQVMKIQRAAQSDPRFKQHSDIEITPEAKEYTNRVFKSLLPHFPAWRQSCPEAEDLGRLKTAWTKAIMRHEIKTGEKLNVRAGLVACEELASDWLISVGRFIKMCDQSGDVLPMANRALGLFNSAQKQIDSVGQMVISKHAFELRQMKASDSNKKFVELYLLYSENNAIEPLYAAALPESVQLSKEQQKAAKNRIFKAREGFFAKFGVDSEEKDEKAPKKNASGVKHGSLEIKKPSPEDIREIKRKQMRDLAEKYGV